MKPARIPTLALLVLAAACRRREAPPPPRPATTAPAPTPTTPTTPGEPAPTPTTPAATGESSVRTAAPAPATGCPATADLAALGPGTVHNSAITRSETWTLEGSPHRFPDGAELHSGVTVTVAPCAVVLVGAGAWLDVGEGAALVATGEAQRPIRIGSNNPTPQPGDWKGVQFNEQARRTSRLAHVVIEHGGQETAGAEACLVTRMGALEVQSLTLRACRAFGAAVVGEGSFATASADLRVTGAAALDAERSGAVYFERAGAVHTLPAGAYTGNAVDEVFVQNGGDANAVRATSTWRNPGVRYHVADDADVYVEGPTGPVLMIAPGTTIAFGRDAGFYVGHGAEGGLVADGQGENTRITFTTAGSDPSPGVWDGVVLGERFNRSRTRLSFVTLAYGGGGGPSTSACDWPGENSDEALLHVQAAPTAQLLGHVRFQGAPANAAAIARNWRGAAVDFAAPALGNDFTQLGGRCRQTPVRDADGNCPEERACD